ncbi:MAG: ABC transporter permease [Clostridiales bacterium]|jgi:simple sugar transport system permease protein|nr:ABC transporter permease [Clostridiales bacterium]
MSEVGVVQTIMDFFNAAVLAATPLLLATLGEILTEKSGNLNLGVEGMMYMGAMAGISASWLYEAAMGAAANGLVSVLLAVAGGILAGALGGLIYSVLTVTLRANQNVTGLTLTIFGAGIGNFFGELLGMRAGGYASITDVTKSMFNNIEMPLLSKIPVLGKMLFSHDFVVYMAVIVAVLMTWFLNKTRVGLNLRAVGESPATADAAGINVARYKYLATCVGGGLCGLGGMYISMVRFSGTWVHGCVDGRGWIAVALVIFAAWSPARAMIGALLFGGLSVLRYYMPIKDVATQFYDMVPYIATVVVLVITSIRQGKERAQPKACGINYFREER